VYSLWWDNYPIQFAVADPIGIPLMSGKRKCIADPIIIPLTSGKKKCISEGTDPISKALKFGKKKCISKGIYLKNTDLINISVTLNCCRLNF